jgi:SOS response regulatory protein OraA/RecX
MPAITNILLNIAQETIEKISPQKLEELGLTREVIDIAISLSEENKYLKAIEIVSNLVQAGLVSEELIRKHLENNLTEEDLKTK